MRNSIILALLALISAARACNHGGPPHKPPVKPVHDIGYSSLDARQNGLLLTYPSVNAGNASTYWINSLNLSQRVEFAGGIQAIELLEKAHKWQVLGTVTSIHGSVPNAPSEQQFNNEVIWDKDAPGRIQNLPDWSEHIALLHPGQYGYQENRDGNPFLGLVVLFDENPADPSQLSGQFHIDFRSFFGHYEPENGDIGNPDNYNLYSTWYGYIDSFVPSQ